MKRIIFMLWCTTAFCAREEETNHIFAGNLALPASQQPSPLFCFGQEVVDKGDLQLFGYTDFLYGNCGHVVEVTPNVIYGATERLTIQANIPVAAQLTFNKATSSGLEDLWLQGEFAVYTRPRKTNVTQSTVVATLFLPTGSAKKRPPTGLGAPSVFLGLTLSYMSTGWNIFVAPGGLFAQNRRTGDGNKFFYQAGCGKNLAYRSKKWLLTLMLELYGQVSCGLTTKNIRGPSFDDNSCYIGPSLWFSTQRWVVQAGIMFPAYQQRLSSHDKNYFFLACNIGYKL